MENSSRTSVSSLVLAVLAGVILGAVIGLYIGWVAWPVEWTDAPPSTLNAYSRQSYLRAAIDSFALNGDAALARERYEALGSSAASTLASIYTNPVGQSSQAVQAFAAAVGGEAALQGPPGAPSGTSLPPAPEPTALVEPAAYPETYPSATTLTPAEAAEAETSGGILGLLARNAMTLGLVCLAALGVLGLLLFLAVRRSRTRAYTRPEREDAAPGLPDMRADLGDDSNVRDTGPVRTSVHSDNATEVEIPDWLQEASPTAASTAADAPPPADPEALPADDLPDWLQEAPAMSSGTAIDYGSSTQDSDALENDDLAWLSADATATPSATAAATPAAIPEREAEPPLEEETPEETRAKFGRDLMTFPAMDPDFASRLRSAGVTAPALILKKAGNTAGRAQLAQRAGVDPDELTAWVYVIDLLRVRGLAPEHAVLLDGIGVHGVVELAAADARLLQQNLAASNDEYRLLLQAPGLRQVQDWVDQARALPTAIS